MTFNKFADLTQSAEHLDVPTNTTLRPTNQQVNNQPTRTSQSMIHQPTNKLKLLVGHLVGHFFGHLIGHLVGHLVGH